ncbi:response regulator transcription factor [Aureibaculum sp. 2210JD6-5]|uniref:response regulator transcription factor n=1 Tax=Aureibaculum sp. 2210JD6-5 TaxID=3103957 RepID=UPI002AAEFCC5|nr:response regulator transcription factor [Aureibaculum sp. 2210JD6-5]MDY7394446.1 response regulator transcription factor [Aureibaculum sp. 2210JD6-5]
MVDEDLKEFLNDKITVHIADDHQILIDGVMAVLGLERDIDVVGYSLNGEQVIEWFEENSSDVLVLDINMPILDGLEVLKKFQGMEDVPKIIILSSYDDIKLIKEVLGMGAMGFVPKKSAGEHIVKAIREVHKGKQYFSDEVKEKMMKTLMGKPMHKADNPEGVLINSLTRREYQILKLIAQQYTTREIGDTLGISESTVETHRKNLIKKVNVKNTVGLAIFAMKNEIV